MSATALATWARSLQSGTPSFPKADGDLFSEYGQRGALGSAMMDNSLMHGPMVPLSVCDLVGARDQTIYALMLELSTEGQPFDFSTIVQELHDRGQLEQVCDAAYIASLLEGAVPDPNLVRQHVENIRRKAQLRRLQIVGENLMREACETGADPGDMLLQLDRTVTGLQAERDLNGDVLPNKAAGLSMHPEILTLSDVEAQEIDWLWRPYLPNRMLAMLSGDPGAGKTYIAMAISAAITLGEEPNKGKMSVPANVLCLSVENSPEYVLRPRFDKLGGDATRFHILRGSVAGDGKHALRGSVKLSDVSLLSNALIQTNARLVIVDPIQSYLGADVDAHRSNETRPVLDGLARLAEEHRCCILLLRHLGKAQTGRAIHRGLGSIDLTGAVRTELIAGSSAHDATQRALVQVKSNLEQFGVSLGYIIDSDGKFRWTGESHLTASAILAAESGSEEAGPLAEAQKFLSVALTKGALPVRDVQAEASDVGISQRTLKRAKVKLGVVSRKRGMSDIWEWTLPEGGHE